MSDVSFKRGNSKFVYEIYEWVNSLVLCIVIIFALFMTVFRTIGVIGSSMFPTVEEGQHIILYSAGYKPTVGDIVVASQPNKLTGSTKEPLFKRVIAKEGDEIDIRMTDNNIYQLYINGQAVEEEYIREPMVWVAEIPINFPAIVPEGHVFLMGDNRNVSRDSRDMSVEMVDSRYIMGKAVLSVWPLNKIGAVEK